MTVTFDAVDGLDTSTVTHNAYGGPLTRDVGDFLLAFLYTRDVDNAGEFPTQTSGVWTLDFQHGITGPKKAEGNYRRRADVFDDDALSWEWLLGDVEASDIVVAAHRQHLERIGSDFNNVGTATLDDSFGTSEGLVLVLFLVSPTGTTCAGADLIHRTDPTAAGMPAGHGTVEAWAFQGAGPHTIDVDALTGVVDFYWWVELKASAVMQLGMLAMRPE